MRPRSRKWVDEAQVIVAVDPIKEGGETGRPIWTCKLSYKGPDPQGVWPKCDRCGRMSRYVYLNPNDQGHECFGCVALKVAVVGRE